MKTIASIVSYNPDISVLETSLHSVITQVDRILIIDNCSNNTEELKTLISTIKSMYPGKVNCIFNQKNYGMAFALNQAVAFCKQDECQWLLTLDQDSILPPNMIEEYSKYCKDDIGQICCNLVNPEETDLDITKMSPLTIQSGNSNYKDAYPVYACITSGSLLNVNAFIESGGVNNELFIDYVDYDISLKLYYHGYDNLFLPYMKFKHHFGNAEKKKVLGISFTDYNYSPARMYYKARNGRYMKKTYPEFKKVFSKSMLYDFGCAVLCLRFKCIRSFLKGLTDSRSFMKNI